MHVEAGRFLYGGAKQVLHIISGLNQQGVENILLCPTDSVIAKSAEATTVVDEVPMAGDLDLMMFFRLRSKIRQHKPDVVHLHSRRGADIFGALAARAAGVPVVLSRRVDNPESKFVSRLKYGLYDHVITISDAIRQVLLSQNVPADKVSLVHSAIDAAEYQQPESRELFLQEFELPADSLVLGVVAQLIARKGHRYILDVLPNLLEQHANAHLLIFGQGPLREALESSVRDAGLEESVTFTGFRDDLPRWLGCLDVLLHPVDMEGLGVSLLQAAAASVPIIGARAGGVPEIIEHEKSGLLIEVGDTQALLAAMNKLLADPEKRQQMGRHGKAIVERKFSVAQMVAGNLAIYNQLLSRSTSS